MKASELLPRLRLLIAHNGELDVGVRRRSCPELITEIVDISFEPARHDVPARVVFELAPPTEGKPK